MKKKKLIILGICGVLILTGCAKTNTDDINNKSNELKSHEVTYPSEMGDIPEFKAEKIVDVTKDEDIHSTTVTYDGLKLEDAKKYLEDIKELGYTDGFEDVDNGEINFLGFKDDSQVTVSYYNDNFLTLSFIDDISKVKK